MSAGAVFQQVLRLIQRANLADGAQADILAVLQASQKKSPFALLYEAGHEAGLPRERLLQRAAGLGCMFAAGNLADDLIDGDCDYLEPAIRVGPSAQYVLQALGFSALAAADIPATLLASVAGELAISASFNHVEVRTQVWTAAIYKEVAENIAGRQWSAYLQLLWAGTPLDGRGERVGRLAAIVGHVSQDLGSEDRRLVSLSDADRADVLAWANAAVAELRAENLVVGKYILAMVEPAFAAFGGAATTSRGDGG